MIYRIKTFLRERKQWKSIKPLFERLRIEEEKIVIFIGSPRSGTTLLGQILNNHPECLVANESRFIDNILSKKWTKDYGLKQIKKIGFSHYMTGLEKDKKHFSETIEQYQKKWNSFSIIQKKYPKKTIKVIGEKKAGGNTLAFIKKKNEFIDLIEKLHGTHFVQIVRNPINATYSYMKSHGEKDFKKACDKCVSLQAYAYRIGKYCKCPQYIMYYEDLLKDPEDEIEKIAKWLNLDVEEKWLKEIRKIVGKAEQKVHSKKETALVQSKIKEYGAEEIFKPYLKPILHS